MTTDLYLELNDVEADERADAELRDQRFEAFVALQRAKLRGRDARMALSQILIDVVAAIQGDRLEGPILPDEADYRDLAEDEGWDAVLTGIAQAMKGLRLEAEETERRR